MRKPSRFALLLFSLAVLASLVLSGAGVRSAAGQGYAHGQVLWASYWTVEPGFNSTLEIKNNRAREWLTVYPSLYFANGEEYLLAPIQMGPRQTAILSLNSVIAGLPPDVRARAGNEGSLEVEFEAANASALMGSMSVTNPERGIAWNFFMYPTRPNLPVALVAGVFWLPDERADGFVIVHNASEEAMTVSPRFWIEGRSLPVDPVHLNAGQGYKLELRRELRRLGLNDASAGGLEFTYEGAPDALKAHGVLFDNRGFSAEIDFNRVDSWDAAERFALRTPRFAIGLADSSLGLPARTAFEPVVALHNFNGEALPLTLSVGCRNENGPQELQLPVRIGPGDTRVLRLHQYLREVIPAGQPWASLEVSYSANRNGLAAMMVSTTRDGEHSIRSVLNWVEASTREGWYWRADREHNTLLGIYNPDTEAATIAVSLDYYADGARYTYGLPERSLPPRSSELLDIGAIIGAQIPGVNGLTIPRSVTFGGYRVRKLNRLANSIITEALLIDRRAQNYLTFYNTGCCWGPASTIPDPDPGISGLPGKTGALEIWASDTCSGESINVVEQAANPLSGVTVSFASGNTSVATIDPFVGGFELSGAGTTEFDWEARYVTLTPYNQCRSARYSGSCPVTASEVQVELSPTVVAPEGTTTVTVTTTPPLGGEIIVLSSHEVANSGGHQHLGRPMGTFTTIFGQTDSNGGFSSIYTASKFGGTETIEADYGGATRASAALDVQVQGLNLLGAGTNYDLVGATATHPQNHYGTATANANLPAIANAYAAQYPGSRLRFNDQSLSQGGLFDVGSPWVTPHIEHRFGTNCDVSKSNVPADRWATVVAIFANNGVTSFLDEGDHWHVRF